MRTDPFRDLDRLTQQVFGTAARPALMAMDAWQDQDRFPVEFDLPGIDTNSIDLDVERNVGLRMPGTTQFSGYLTEEVVEDFADELS